MDLSEPIVSRFDLVLVLKDEASEQHDRDIANYVINSHYGGQVINNNNNIDDESDQRVNNENILASRDMIDDDIEPIDTSTLRMYVN